MKNLIAWFQWSFFAIGVIAVTATGVIVVVLYKNWEAITDISIPQCVRAISLESANIQLEATLELQKEDLEQREDDLKTGYDKLKKAEEVKRR